MDFVVASRSDTEKIPQLKILVVDDDVLNQRMMQVLLTREGHDVVVASNGLEALNLIKLRTYDIVFIDLQMPIMDGLEASRQIREWEKEGHHSFIVALTASYLPEEGHILFEAGIDNYISKPFAMKQIQHLLKYGLKARFSDATSQPGPQDELPVEEVLDIQKGIEQVGGDVDMYRELLKDFATELPIRLEAIQQFFAMRDMVGLSRAAHNLYGVAANLGALQLSEYAKRLDKQSGAGYTESIAQLLQEIQLVASKLLEISNNFLAEKKISVESV